MMIKRSNQIRSMLDLELILKAFNVIHIDTDLKMDEKDYVTHAVVEVVNV